MKKTCLTLLVLFAFLSTLKGQTKTQPADNATKNSNAFNTLNFVFQFGGESKITLLPKFNFVRVHKLNSLSPYYGSEAGFHPLFIASAYTLSGIIGIEKGVVSLETSTSYFRTTKIHNEEKGYNGYFSQTMLNFKLGFNIKKSKIKIGISSLLNEDISSNQTRIPLLDIGKLNGTTYGIEFQSRINL